jgi:hypothetical protein
VEIVEAGPADGPRLAAFLLENPVGAGTDFVLDRSPDFNALLGLRGRFRTFCACEGNHLVGTATALWDERTDEGVSVRVGELVDLRVASASRGGRTARHLLAAALRAFEEADVQWLCALIGDDNRAATSLVDGKAGFPRLAPLTRYVSVHLIAARIPFPTGGRVEVRSATTEDAHVIRETSARAHRGQRLTPTRPFEWPDSSGRHRAWLASGVDGEVIGGLVVWDGFDVRRVRVMRYAGADHVLRLVTGGLARLRLATPLPPPGGALRMWASRALWNDHGHAAVTRGLVAASLRAACLSGVHVVQLNFPEGDPLLGHLPPYPRSSFRSTIHGARRDGRHGHEAPSAAFFSDLALV